MTTTLHSDTSTARSVQSVASFTQRNWVKPTRTAERPAGETPKSNKSNCGNQTHTHTHMCRNACTHTYADSSYGTSQILLGGCSDSVAGTVSSQREASEWIHFFCQLLFVPLFGNGFKTFKLTLRRYLEFDLIWSDFWFYNHDSIQAFYLFIFTPPPEKNDSYSLDYFIFICEDRQIICFMLWQLVFAFSHSSSKRFLKSYKLVS